MWEVWGIDRAKVLWQILTQEILKKDAAAVLKKDAGQKTSFEFMSRTTPLKKLVKCYQEIFSSSKVVSFLSKGMSSFGVN